MLDPIQQLLWHIQQLDSTEQYTLALLILKTQPAEPMQQPREQPQLVVPYTRDYESLPGAAVWLYPSWVVTPDLRIKRSAIKAVKLENVEYAGWVGRDGSVDVVLSLESGDKVKLRYLAYDGGKKLAAHLRLADD